MENISLESTQNKQQYGTKITGTDVRWGGGGGGGEELWRVKKFVTTLFQHFLWFWYPLIVAITILFITNPTYFYITFNTAAGAKKNT